MSGLISISGLASGLDVDGIIAKIMAFESRGIDRLQLRIDDQNKILTGVSAFESRLLALQVDFGRLSTASAFKLKTTESSDESVLTASAGTSASPGVFSLTVDQLAQSHQVVSQGFASKTTEIGTGSFSLTVGSRTTVDITIDGGNNTIDGLASAINSSGTGVSASVINSGSVTDPYVLLISAEDTGSTERIVIDANLSGGTAPVFGSVGAVIDGVKSGTSTVSSTGNFTGDASGTITYTVATGGTIGVDDIVINYADGANLSGSFTVSSSYVPGQQVDVFGGIKLSFGAGTLIANDSFSTDVTSGSIQAPADARFTLGNNLGGASGITLTSGSNTVADVVEGVTLSLHKVSAAPVTVSVKNDIGAVSGYVKGVIDQYNGFVDMVDELFYYQQDAAGTGVLLGDRATMDMYSELQAAVTGVAEGMKGSLSSLTDVGISMSGEGKLILNQAELDSALASNLDDVLEMLATWGSTSDSDIRFLGANDKTVAYTVTSPFQQGYAVDITQAAEKAVLSGTQMATPSSSSPLVVDATNDGLKIKVGSQIGGDIRLSRGSYASGEALAAEIQAKIKADDAIPDNRVGVTWVDDGGGMGHMEFASVSYGSTESVELQTGSGNMIYSSIGHAAGTIALGKDVLGTINGEAATGKGQILTGADGNQYAEGLQLLVTISVAELTTQGSAQGNVTVTKGLAARVDESLSRMTDTTDGDVKIRKDVITDTIDNLQGRIDGMDARLEIRHDRLVKEFLQLEQALSDLQSQQDYLTQSLAALGATTSRVVGS